MATELITTIPKGTTLFEARLFRRKGALYLYLKSPILEDHFRAVSGDATRVHLGWTAVDVNTLAVLSDRQKMYNIAAICSEHSYGYGPVLGRCDGNSRFDSPNLAVFLQQGLADGICYRADGVMISFEAASAYLNALRDGMRKYFEKALGRLDLTMTVTTLRELV
jgi:hypothetical protein